MKKCSVKECVLKGIYKVILKVENELIEKFICGKDRIKILENDNLKVIDIYLCNYQRCKYCNIMFNNIITKNYCKNCDVFKKGVD